jgi:arabinan endo-1,5-alpha-L-arabinosidase
MSVRVALQPNGNVTGAYTGTWQRPWGNHITVDLDGAGRFVGVLSRGWNETSQQFVVSFSAQSQEGISIWASKLAH